MEAGLDLLASGWFSSLFFSSLQAQCWMLFPISFYFSHLIPYSSQFPHLPPQTSETLHFFFPLSLFPATMDLTLWQYQFRIIMLGDSTVGKSSLLKRYTENLFLESINETVGVDFYVHFLEVEPGVRVKLQFWDTAGQERFRSGNLSVT